MANPKSVLLLSLRANVSPLPDEKYQHLLTHLQAKAVVHQITDPKFANDYLENISVLSNTKAIILTDSGMTTQIADSPLSKNLARYVKSGGTLIMACEWSYTFSDAEFRKYMSDVWETGWRHGAVTKGDFGVEDVYPRGGERALKPYNMLAVLLEGVDPDDILYRGEDPLEVAVAFKKVGEGYLGYIGDVKWETGSTEVLLAMCSL